MTARAIVIRQIDIAMVAEVHVVGKATIRSSRPVVAAKADTGQKTGVGVRARGRVPYSLVSSEISGEVHASVGVVISAKIT